MRQSQYAIVVLKPTAAFLSFLTSKLPEIKLPDLRLLQIDNTAYVLERHLSGEVILDQIEKHFSVMFRHEIFRWLGDKVHNEMEVNFLDFLCCFKFELHHHILLMEPSIEKGRQLLLIEPRLALLNWINSAERRQEGLHDVVEKIKLMQLENTTVLVKSFSNLTEIKPFIKKNFLAISSTAMRYTLGESEQWPIIDSFQTFNQYFAIEIHTQLIHLAQSKVNYGIS
ncbi:hypothetical protein Lgra_2916 [Legionella gratiana]|uniref:Uncharacterized protein n=1 Tax=Legionella gratiana TaxID=45066 RepID=A0A378J676_9GAMM|nr:hypothetical protein [Legionella gratiana]KTD06139.1 hypothetical protein Lgra_2916 [Legionella gratiana]STX42939.1 Uncharacterised protein [Legionella gratiana]